MVINNEIVWNEDTYDKFINYLYSLQDLKYRDFHGGLGVNKDYLIGIRTPILKNIAKDITKTDYNRFIDLNTHKTYEERIIHGLLIGYIKSNYEDTIKYLDNFIEYVDNWAICDMTISNLKQVKKDKDKYFKYVKKLLKSKKEFTIRFGLIMLLNYYLDDEYIDTVLDITTKKYINEYYVNMGLAWLISYCYIKYPSKTEKLFKEQLLSKWVNNKSIQKIKESYRVSLNDKIELEKYKR